MTMIYSKEPRRSLSEETKVPSCRWRRRFIDSRLDFHAPGTPSLQSSCSHVDQEDMYRNTTKT